MPDLRTKWLLEILANHIIKCFYITYAKGFNVNLGIFIGVGNYTSQQYNDLPACNKDAETLKSVFESIKNFTEILFLNGIVDQ